MWNFSVSAQKKTERFHTLISFSAAAEGAFLRADVTHLKNRTKFYGCGTVRG